MSEFSPLGLPTQKGARLAAIAVAAGFFLAIVAGITALVFDVVRQIDEESESRSDNAQWTLSQLEVELLYLLASVDHVHHDPAVLNEVRTRFDILYSRVETLRVGKVFKWLSETEAYDQPLSNFNRFIAVEVPFMDGPDAALRDRLPTLAEHGKALLSDARLIALTGIKMMATNSDAKRAQVARTLTLAGGLTLILVASLVSMLLLLGQMMRYNRQRAAENLATLSRLDAVLSTAMEALVTIDAKGRIVDFNDAASQTFGYAQDEAVGADMAGLILASPDKAFPFRPAAAPQIDADSRFQITARHKTGREIPMEVSISRMGSGEDMLFVAFLRDLSVQLEAESALVAARDKALAGERAKTDLLVVMSHEIRTPLNGLIGTIDLLDSTPLRPQQRDYLRIMQASGNLLMSHVNDVLDIARLDSGKATGTIQPLDLTSLITEVMDNQMPAAQANGNDILYEPPADGRTMIEGDRARLRQVILNLVGNAIKFTQNGRVTISVNHAGPEGPTEIAVSDTGIGIRPEDKERIFEDFVTLDASYARRASGTGLGLGIALRIVRHMGGTLTVDSTVGKGSTFRITLPAKIISIAPEPVDAAAGDAAGPTPHVDRPLDILVVEDNNFNRLIAREMLLKLGHDVHEAQDGEEGIRMANGRRYDLILMDISMPGIDGLQAAQTIIAGDGPSRATPIVAMTAHALAEETARFRAGGMKDVLLKPITRVALKSAIKTAMAHRSGTDDQSDTSAAHGALLDQRILVSLTNDLGQAKANSLLSRFCVESDEIVTRIVTALQERDVTEQTIREVHRLQGSAGMFGAIELQQLLANLETQWKEGVFKHLPVRAAALRTVWEMTAAALQDRLDLDQSSSLR